MKRKVSIIVTILFFGVIGAGLLSSPAYSADCPSFWYGECDEGGNPVYGGNTGLPGDPTRQVFNVQDKTCEELWTGSRNNPGIVEQIQRAQQRFDNSVEGEPSLTIYNRWKAWWGVTLLSCAGDGCRIATDFDPDAELLYGALLINMKGEYVHGWLKEDMNGIPAKLHPGGHVAGGIGGGFGGASLVMLDWCGNTVWEQTPLPPSGSWHHDFNIEFSPTGYYSPLHPPWLWGDRLIPTNFVAPIEDTAHISNFPLLDEYLQILDKDGNLTWDWYSLEHFEEMGFSPEAMEGIANVRMGRPNAANSTDWTHFNQLGWLGLNKHYISGDKRFHPKNIIFDSRSSSMLGIIDHKTGEIVWKVDPESRAYPFGQIIGPHTAHMIPEGLPGSGNIAVFDNGGRSVFGGIKDSNGNPCTWTVNIPSGPVETSGVWPVALRDYSRFIEFDPITMNVVQLYENKADFIDSHGNLNRKHFSSFISSVQRLPNGNTLICEGNQARVFEITRDNKIVWEYNAISEPGGPGVIGRALYRAYRYPVWWILNNKDCSYPNVGDVDVDDAVES